MRLEAFEAAILGRDTEHPGLATAHRMRKSLHATGVPERHCIDLIAAFKQDAVKTRYEDWAGLMGYCYLSASPVGRYLLDLHGEAREGYRQSDALCNALQVINHLQDCQDDYRALDRVYLPGDWMAAEGTSVADLDGRASSPGLRRVLDRCLDATAELMIEARRLPGVLTDRRLAMESAAIVAMADRLIVKLRRQDPVAERVELSKPAFLACFAAGVWRGLKP
jgi:squalene synthase HpnC